MAEKLRLLTVHAHPDDESSKGAATTARYVAEGHDVMVLTCTGGEAGSILNPAMERPEVQARMPEGDPPPPLPEGCFATVDIAGPIADLVKVIREFRPHVVITYDENGGYPHPDHIRCHEVSVAAFDAAGDPDLHPGAGQPWQPLKLYYSHGFSRRRMQLFHDALLERGMDSPYGEWLQKWDASRPDPDTRVTTRVECGEYFEVRDDALRAHATQIDPNSRWFAVPLDIQRELWPTEDYELVRSLVDTTLPEDDLFSGVEEKVCA